MREHSVSWWRGKLERSASSTSLTVYGTFYRCVWTFRSGTTSLDKLLTFRRPFELCTDWLSSGRRGVWRCTSVLVCLTHTSLYALICNRFNISSAWVVSRPQFVLAPGTNLPAHVQSAVGRKHRMLSVVCPCYRNVSAHERCMWSTDTSLQLSEECR